MEDVLAWPKMVLVAVSLALLDSGVFFWVFLCVRVSFFGLRGKVDKRGALNNMVS